MSFEQIAKIRDYWSERVSPHLPAPEFRPDYSRSQVDLPDQGAINFAITGDQYKRLMSLTGEGPFLIYTTLITALMICLSRYTDQQVVIIGSPNRRPRDVDAAKYPSNALPIVQEIDPQRSFRELLPAMRENLLEAYSMQDCSYYQLCENLGVVQHPYRCPLFDIALISQDIHGALLDVKNDITISFRHEERQIVGRAYFRTALFRRATIERLIHNFLTVLGAGLVNTGTPVCLLDMLAPSERRQQLVEWNKTEIVGEVPTCVHHLFEFQVEQSSESVAVVFEGRHLTYRELNETADKLAHYLREQGVGPESLVGLCLENSPEMIIGILGALKAGAAYLPLDVSYPKERLALMLSDARPDLILTERRLTGQLSGFNFPLQCLDENRHLAPDSGGEKPETGVSGRNLVYVIYTSGSTGEPKGVPVEHRSLANHALAMIDQIELGAGDRFLKFASLSFDASCVQIYPTLLSGATLVLHRAPGELANMALLDFCRREHVNILDVPAAFWRQWVDELWAHGVSLDAQFRVSMTGGESITGEHVRRWASLSAPGARLLASYGPTEATVTSAMYSALAGATDELVTSVLPIGRPIAGVGCYILDSRFELMPIGAPGELWISGRGVARGYLGCPDQVSRRFLPHPFAADPGVRLYRTGDVAHFLEDGSLQFLGRRDNQVKVRGFRVELGEVETRLQEHPSIREAAVFCENDRLIAFVRPNSSDSLDSRELKDFLEERLPSFCIPARFVVLDKLPTASGGKIDRRALAAIASAERAVEYVGAPPRTPLEQALVEIWSQVLGLESVGIFDNFFELGGHSLLATQVVSWVKDVLKVDAPLATLFEAPEIAAFAEVVEALRGSSGAPEPPLEPIPRDQDLDASFAQQRLWILDQVEPETCIYNVPLCVRLDGRLNYRALEKSFTEIVRLHESLRTTFRSVDNRVLQVIAPPQPMKVPRVDLSGIAPAERGSLAKRFADELVRFPFNLSAGPLLRTSLFRMAAKEHLLIVTMHHIITDAWSIGIFVRQLGAAYEAFSQDLPSPLPELQIQYADFAVWQRRWLQGEVWEAQRAYWKKQLDDLPDLELPTTRRRQATPSFSGATSPFELQANLSTSLIALSRREGATLFMTLLAAFKILLRRLTGQNDIIVGTDLANRNRAGLENLIGFFVNHAVLRTDLSGNPTFRQFLKRVRGVAIGAYSNQDLPFDEVVKLVSPRRNANGSALYRVLFDLQNAPMTKLELTELDVTPLKAETGTAKLDLSLSLTGDEERLVGSFEYNTSLLDAATVARMASGYRTLLHSIVSDPDSPIESLSLTSEEESRLAAAAFAEPL